MNDRGFSLIELLVAVAILSLAAVTLLESQSQAIGLSSGVEQRALASIVAENRLNLALGLEEDPAPGIRNGEAEQMGATFRWRETVREAPGGDLMIVTVSVRGGADPRELITLTGFRRAP